MHEIEANGSQVYRFKVHRFGHTPTRRDCRTSALRDFGTSGVRPFGSEALRE
jgi:hypothetical protein